MTDEQREDMLRLLKETNALRRETLARLREIEAVIEGILNKCPTTETG